MQFTLPKLSLSLRIKDLWKFCDRGTHRHYESAGYLLEDPRTRSWAQGGPALLLLLANLFGVLGTLLLQQR
jgi:hypothetical protein